MLEEIKTYNKLLDIKPDDELTDAYINGKYLKAALKFHPDKEKWSASANPANMALLNEARDTLLDPNRRAIYNEKIFGNRDFVLYFQSAISEVQANLRKPTDEHSPAFYRLKNYCLIMGINYCNSYITEHGHDPYYTLYMQEFLNGLNASFYHYPICQNYCSDICLTIVSRLIEPLEKQIEALKSSSDKLSRIKASQLVYVLEKINETVFNSHFEAMTNYEDGIRPVVPFYFEARAANSIYLNLQSLLSDCASKKEINSHRNLIVATVKALTGALVFLLTALPTLGLALFSRSYRNAIHSTFFATNSRACLENADTSLYNVAKSMKVVLK
jgi:curved DNA-binding protein CbpA